MGMEFTIKVFATDAVIRWAVDYHLQRGTKINKKVLKQFLKDQIGLFGTDEDSLIGQNYYEEDEHPDLEKTLIKLKLISKV